jgi:tRNA 2-thiouridine synthesizing protein A
MSETAQPSEWDAGDMGCGELLMLLRVKIRAHPPGTVFRLRATDPAAPEDVPAWCRLTRCLIVFVVSLLTMGCGSQRPAADVERGRQGVVAALDSVKANTPPEKLKSLADPVEFTEELRTHHALVEYTLGKVDASDPEVIRFAVVLTLKDRKGKVTDREVVYAVTLNASVIVARDPYF